MKILFVDNSADLQENWIYPLRKKGWGVVRARSAEDATRMMILHGEGLEAIAITEKFVSWAEKQELPFVVLRTEWTDTDVIKHQNSDHSAVSYLPFSRGCEELFSLFEYKQEVPPLKRTGTDGLSLEEYSQILSRPEPTRTSSGLHLSASEIVLGGSNVEPVPEVAFEPTRLIDSRTVILDKTKLNFDLLEDSSLDEFPHAEPLQEIEALDAFIENIAHSSINLTPPPLLPPIPQSYPVSNQFAINPSPSDRVSDLGTLKSYLSLREQDVALLGGQVRSSQERIQQLEALLKVEKVRSTELSHMVSRQESQLKNYDQEKSIEFEVLEKHIEDIDFQLKDRTDKVRLVEAKLRVTVEEVSKVKERVRVDIRRIRVREKELEGQLEILKKDSSALLQSRDEKIIELKRKLDLLEFNMELVQEQYSKERKTSDELKTRLKDAAHVMKQAGGLLEQ